MSILRVSFKSTFEYSSIEIFTLPFLSLCSVQYRIPAQFTWWVMNYYCSEGNYRWNTYTIIILSVLWITSDNTCSAFEFNNIVRPPAHAWYLFLYVDVVINVYLSSISYFIVPSWHILRSTIPSFVMLILDVLYISLFSIYELHI